MSEFPSLRQRIYEDLRDHLSEWRWQWHATLTFPDNTDYFFALRRFNRWRLRIIDQERLRLGIYLLTSYKKGTIHFHALLLGKNRHGKTLLESSPRKWEGAWQPYFSRIRVVESNSYICHYVAMNSLPFKSDVFDTHYYDSRLLQQESICREFYSSSVS